MIQFSWPELNRPIHELLAIQSLSDHVLTMIFLRRSRALSQSDSNPSCRNTPPPGLWTGPRSPAGRPPALVGHREVVDEVPLHPIVFEVALNLDIPPLVAFAGRCSRLHAHLMAERAEERLELSDGPVVCLRRSSHRVTALGMIWHSPRLCLRQAQSVRGWFTKMGMGAPRAPETKVYQRSRGQRHVACGSWII